MQRWTNFKNWALHTQLEFLHADVGFLQYRHSHPQCLTSLKSVVVNQSFFVIPEFLLSAPNIRFFRCGISFGYTEDSDINHECLRMEKYLEFLENFQHLNHLIIDMFLVDKIGVRVKVRSAMTQIFDKYLQRTKNKNLRRVQVSQVGQQYPDINTVRSSTVNPTYAMRSFHVRSWLYDKVVSETKVF